MKSKNKIITAVLLAAGTAAGTALINKYIKVSATSKKLLSHPEPSIYKWRLGDIYYTKTGTGKPLLLIHDLTHASSGCEWDNLIPFLKDNYTIYTHRPSGLRKIRKAQSDLYELPLCTAFK